MNQISLEKFSLDRASELFALVNENRAYLRKSLPWLDSTTELQHSRDFISETLEKVEKGESGSAYFIVVEGGLAGIIETHHIDYDKNLFYLGYWLAEKYQGRGIITEACKKVIAEMFARGFKTAEIRCAVGNPKSCAVAERLGFREIETLEKESKMYGELIDMRVWRLNS